MAPKPAEHVAALWEKLRQELQAGQPDTAAVLALVDDLQAETESLHHTLSEHKRMTDVAAAEIERLRGLAK